MKIDQQSEGQVEKPHVREDLGFINWMQGCFALQFDCQDAVHHHVRSEPAVKLYVLIEQRNRLLSFNSHPDALKFMR